MLGLANKQDFTVRKWQAVECRLAIRDSRGESKRSLNPFPIGGQAKMLPITRVSLTQSSKPLKVGSKVLVIARTWKVTLTSLALALRKMPRESITSRKFL